MKRFFVALTFGIALLSAAAAAGQTGIKTLPAAGSYIVNTSELNVRDSPDTLSGKVIGRVTKGSKVEVIEMTALLYPVQSMRAAWFRIKKPAGWIYGYYLNPIE
jgi:uncharacterized protein YgiM (DUF1202 family)